MPMDDARIEKLRAEVLAQLAEPKDPVAADLEARVESLERCAPSAHTVLPVVTVTIHPSHQLLDVPGGSTDGRCVLEPDKPCVGSGQCRSLGH
jgi:hypothetical protein